MVERLAASIAISTDAAWTKPRRAHIGILLILTCVNLGVLARADAFARMRSVDTALLFTAGMAAGVALYLLVLSLRGA